jgi:hypothetical protein
VFKVCPQGLKHVFEVFPQGLKYVFKVRPQGLKHVFKVCPQGLEHVFQAPTGMRRALGLPQLRYVAVHRFEQVLRYPPRQPIAMSAASGAGGHTCYPLPTSHRPLPLALTTRCPLLSACSPPPLVDHCPLPVACCPLPAAHCLLPAARYSLPAAHCSLPADLVACCSLPADLAAC